MKQIKYRSVKSYKYQIVKDYKVNTGITGYRCFTPFLALFKNGNLIIKKYYSWDGASAIAIDTHTILRGSLVHDAFFQMFRMGLVPLSEKTAVNRLLETHCLEDGMNRIRAKLVFWAVENFSGFASKVQPPPKTYLAPRRKNESLQSRVVQL